MFDVITFGSATRDMFLFSDEYVSLKNKNFVTGEGLCVSAGSKIYLKDVIFASGGGGTNTAATFANQGLKVAYVGKVGGDPGGQALMAEMDEKGIETRLVKKENRQKTAYSVVLSKPGVERTILVYRGSCHTFHKNDVPWPELKTRWFYIAPLSGESASVFPDLLSFAERNKISVALNPGHSQLDMGREGVAKLFAKVDVLILNQEEGARVTGVDFQKDEKILRALKDWVKKGKVILSKGPAGVLAADNEFIYKAGIPRSPMIDRTGAGDAFGSGLVSRLIKGEEFEKAIQFGTANATACLQEVGAKNGLLSKDKWGPWSRVRVFKYKL